jgi:protein O-mannosyl-transferase
MAKKQKPNKPRVPSKPKPHVGGSSRPPDSGGRRETWGICLFLTVITFAVFGQTLRHDFVNYDDDRYVYEDALVSKGITGAGIEQAFAQGSWANWDPLTTLSHMLDCQFYGLHAGGHHLTSVLLHAASAILLFLALRKMTGATWRSGFVAAVFAIHPLHVQSVAWVAERKDTLSGLFFMLTLWAYAGYVKNPGFPRYLPVILFFACGLMSKSMLVTVPFVLFLLDYWPLGRISDLRFTIYEPPAGGTTSGHVGRKKFSPITRSVLEKLPLLAMCVWQVPCSPFKSAPSPRSNSPLDCGWPTRCFRWRITSGRCSGRRGWRCFIRIRIMGCLWRRWASRQSC